MDGAIRIANEKKAKRVINALKRKQTRAKVDEEMGIKGAHKQLERLQKDVEGLKKTVAGLEVTVYKLWAWKITQK